MPRSTTSRGRSRRRSSSATCVRRSTSASTRRARSRRRSTSAEVEQVLDRLRARRRRGARRLPDQLLRQPRPRGADQGDRQPARARPRGVLQRRGAAGDPRVRAHLDDRDQRLRDADRAPLSGHAAGRPRRRGREDAAPDHAVERRPHDRRRGGGAARSTSSSPAPRPGSSARRRSRAASGSASSSPSTWAGTTAKASIVEDGEVSRAAEYQVGGGIMHGSRLLTGAGYLLRVPAIDLAEVGAGRRLARLDRSGRRAPGGAAERRRVARAALLRPRAAPSRRSPTPT